MERVIVFGSGPVARGAYARLACDPRYEVAAFTVDPEYISDDRLFGLPVLPFPDVASLYRPDEYRMLIAVGYVKVNRLRAERYYQAIEMGYELISHVSSETHASPGMIMGNNCLIGGHCLIAASARIGNNVIIDSGCIIAHDTTIEDHCFLGAGVVMGGGVTLQPYCFVGLNSTIRNKITIARECVIGAGSVILQDTRPREVYMARQAELMPITSDRLSLS